MMIARVALVSSRVMRAPLSSLVQALLQGAEGNMLRSCLLDRRSVPIDVEVRWESSFPGGQVIAARIKPGWLKPDTPSSLCRPESREDLR
jgi:hypothetical protein